MTNIDEPFAAVHSAVMLDSFDPRGGPMPRPIRSDLGLRGVRPATRTFIALVVLVMATAAGASPASGHGGLTSASPEPESTVKGAPPQVRLLFAQPTVTDELTTVSVLTPAGKNLAAGRAVTAGLVVGQSVSESAETGWYTVRFAVVSFDGHLTSGEFRFLVTAADSGQDPARWLWILVALVTVVVLVVLAFVRRRRPSDVRRTAQDRVP